MDNLYRSGLREGPLRRNDPLVDAIYYYLELVQSITNPTCHSGLQKLYLLQSGGIDMGGVSSGAPFTVATPWALAPADNLREALATSPYVGLAIMSNLRAYIDIMSVAITQKLNVAQFSDREDGSGDRELPYNSPDWSRRYSYNLSSLSLDTLRQTIARVEQVLPGELAAHNTITAFDQARGVVDAELNRLISSGGMGPNPPSDCGVIKTFLTFVNNFLNSNTLSRAPFTGTTQSVAVVIARILLTILRLLYGQVAPITQDENIRAGTSFKDRLRISDETLAALPSPTRALVDEFQETEVPIISRLGALYLSCLERCYVR